MAIYHFSMKPVSRAKGRSAVASIAYRAGEKLTNERDGITHDYTHRSGVEHAEIVLPEPGAGTTGVNADWARDRSVLWNAAEFAEKRKDARVAREFEIALPHELSAEQRLEATWEIAQELANRYGAAVDFAIHTPHEEGDVRNHHAHLLMTTRQVTEDGLGDKTYLERENKWLLASNLPTTDMQLRDLRQRWEGIANERLAMAGLDIRIDHRSHMERGLEIAPTEHMGVHATQMERRGLEVTRSRLDEEAAQRNADLIREKPEQVLILITGEKSVFDRRDVARALHRYINDDVQAFQNAFAQVMASPALVELQPERPDPVTGEIALGRYSTREMVEIESGMIERAQRMHEARDHGVSHRYVERALNVQDKAISLAVASDTASKVERGEMDAAERDRQIEAARLSDEQRQAIEHITGPEQISAVVGFAGAGKSTMLAAAREAWEAEGYKVHGAALSGKAAEGLEESSGIHSRTLASWSYRWDSDRGQLNRGDVFVIDEAGMIGSRQLARFVGEAEARGAKIVLVGDHEQLQAIGAGAPFRAIAEEIGHAELSEIRRQRVDWQRAASVDFATHRTAEGLAAYHAHGDIRFSETGEGVRGQIVRDYLADRDERPEGSRVAMAHRRADVRALNADIRAALQERGELAQGNVPAVGSDAGALTFQTNDGKREFAPGDRIVFLENDRDLGVKNGMLGTVEHVAAQRPGAGPMIIATLDRGDSIAVPMDSYQAVDHGYATTIHKNQGATVDRSFVLASGTMDRHLTYVAMTRHRDEVQLYAAEDEFTKAGKLVENGAAPFEHDPKNSDSYFVTLENDQGQQRTIWGVDLERAMTEASPEIGEKIGLEHVGSTPVTLPDGTETHRNTWQVREANELAYAQLEKHLSRSGVKETTLDYASDLAERQFAERRGIAESMGVVSEIELPAERQRKSLSRSERSVPASWGRGGDIEDRDHAREDASTGRLHSFSAKDKDEDHARGSSQKPGVDLAQDLREDPHADLGKNLASERAQQERVDENSPQIDQQSPQQVERKRGGIFAGLKLTVSSGAPTAPSQASWMQPERERSLRPAPAPASPAFDRLAERVRAQSPLEVAVDRYARAYQSIAQHHADGLPILDMQRQEIRAAGKQLDQVHAGMKDLMVSTLGHDPEAARAMTALSGRERVSHVIDAMQHENAALQDPHVRADRFMNRWQELQDQQRELRGWRHDEARARIGDQLQGLAKSLERDPQVDSILRNRSRELGIRHTLSRGESVAQALQVDRSRGQSMSRGFGIEM